MAGVAEMGDAGRVLAVVKAAAIGDAGNSSQTADRTGCSVLTT